MMDREVLPGLLPATGVGSGLKEKSCPYPNLRGWKPLGLTMAALSPVARITNNPWFCAWRSLACSARRLGHRTDAPGRGIVDPESVSVQQTHQIPLDQALHQLTPLAFE